MKTWYSFIFSLILAAAALFPPSTINAQFSPQAYVQDLRITAALQKDGTVAVTQQVRFFSPTQLEWQIFTNLRKLSVQADGAAVPNKTIDFERVNGHLTIFTEKAATEWTLSYITSSTLIRSDGRDQFFLKLFQESGYAIEQLEINFFLPENVTSPGLQGNIYGINGIANASTTVVSPRQLTYTTQFVGSQAIVTINAHWPKKVLNLSSAQELRLLLSSLEVAPWVVFGIFLPLASLLVLVSLLIKQRLNEHGTKEVISVPPSSLSPLIVGALIDKKVYPKEIVALLFDLCQRGFIVIVKKNNDYYLSKRRAFTEGLEEWEQDILEQLFPITNTKLSSDEMKLIGQQSLFSPKVRRAFSTIYQTVTQKHFFAENPHLTRVRYKLVALGIYFSSVIAALWIAIEGASPYLLLPLAGTIGVAFLIMRLTPRLVHYTSEGLTARNQWLAFGNFLAEQEPLPLEASLSHTFERYLPYAIAMNKTVEWAKRFDLSHTVIVKPDWFISYEEGSVTDFIKEVESFSRSISQILTAMRGPLVS